MELFGFNVETLCFGFVQFVLISVTSRGKQNVPSKMSKCFSMFHPKCPQLLNTRATERALVPAFKPPTTSTTKRLGYRSLSEFSTCRTLPRLISKWSIGFVRNWARLQDCWPSGDPPESLVAGLEALSDPKVSKVECPWHQILFKKLFLNSLVQRLYTSDHLSNAKAVHDISLHCASLCIIVPHCASPLQGIVPVWLVTGILGIAPSISEPVSAQSPQGLAIGATRHWSSREPCGSMVAHAKSHRKLSSIYIYLFLSDICIILYDDVMLYYLHTLRIIKNIVNGCIHLSTLSCWLGMQNSNCG